MAKLIAITTVAAWAISLATGASAQEDKDRITRFIQDALSGMGRDVQIEGFRGALSSRATMDKLTIADNDGIWLTLTDAVLDWNRSAVLRGEIEITEISAALIELPRLPASSGAEASPAAGTFALPELPISLEIASIKANRVVLGAPVVGQPATLSVEGSVSLAGGDGTAELAITRIEGPSGVFGLDASFSNASQVLDIDLSLTEDANGLSANLLNLPGKPSVALAIKGDGPLDSFVANLTLQSDGQERLSGRIETQASAVDAGADRPQRVIEADLSGDLAPLFVPEYQDFFGTNVALQSMVSLFEDGRISLDDLTVTAAALQLEGRMALSADRLPQEFSLNALLEDPDGEMVLLPLSGVETRVQRAQITAEFDASEGDAWTLNGDLQGLLRDDVAMDQLTLVTNGTISQGDTRRVSARIDADATGVAVADLALARALGGSAVFGATIDWQDGQPVDFSDFTLTTPGMKLAGFGTVDGLDTALDVDGELSAQVDDISRFSDIAGQDLQGAIDAALVGNVALLTGAFDMDLTATGRDLGIGIPEVDEALAGNSELDISALRTTEGLFLNKLDVSAGPLSVQGDAELSPDWLPQVFNLNASLKGADGKPVLIPLVQGETRVGEASILARFDAAQGEAWTLSGDLRDLTRDDVTMDRLLLDTTGTISDDGARRVTARIDSRARGVALSDPGLADALGAQVQFSADLLWQDGQPIQFSDLRLAADGMTLTGAGALDTGGDDTTLQAAVMAQVDNLSRFAKISGQPLRGALRGELSGQVALTSQAFDMTLNATGQNLAVGVDLADDLMAGESRLDLSANGTPTAINLRALSLRTPQLEVDAAGQVESGDSDVQFSALLKQTERIYDGLPGQTQVSGRAYENADGWRVTLEAKAPRTSTLSATISLPKDGTPDAQFTASIGSLSWVAPELAGPASLRGTARQSGSQWVLDVSADGPGGTNVAVAGTIAQDMSRAALGIDGSLSLGLLNRRLAPNSMQGVGQFDLRLDGPLALTSLSGRASTNGARLAVPSLRNALEGIDASVTLNGRNAQVDVTANVNTGGSVSARGRVGMQVPYVTEIALQLNDVRVSDPELYETGLNGALRLSGSIPSNLSIVGRVAIDETEILVPSTGIGALGDIPDITHINEPSDVRRTRSYAGMLDVTGASEGNSSTAIGLDVQIIAENRIFVRGRGLDAELGGRVRLMGTTADVIAQGEFGLIRGRLDILGERLTLEEGSAKMQGSLIPTLRLVARTTVDETVIRVVVDGPADEPEITFESDPDLPEDEVLALLLFGRDMTSISALQAVQLASAVATLAGKGGTGIVEKIRQRTGFDDLDVTSDGEGTTSLRAGKYISENIYTDVVIDSDGNTSVNLNLDLSRTTTLRGEASSDGSTGIGVFFERDY